MTMTECKREMRAPAGVGNTVDTFNAINAVKTINTVCEDSGNERPRFEPDPDALAPVNMDTVSEQTLIELLYRYFYGAAASDGLPSSDRQALSNRPVLSNRQVPPDGLVPSFLDFAISLGIRLSDIRRMYLKSAAFAEAVGECECIRREIIARRVLDGSIPVNQAKFLLDDDVVGYSEKYLAGGTAAGNKSGDIGSDSDCGEGFRLIVHFDDPALQRAGREGEVRQ